MIRGKKWYWQLFLWNLGVAMNNAHHLYKITGGKLTFLDFIRYIVQSYLRLNSSARQQRNRQSIALPVSSRYDNIGHLVSYNETQRRCACCAKKSNFLCNKCDVGLHPKDCFITYHMQWLLFWFLSDGFIVGVNVTWIMTHVSSKFSFLSVTCFCMM